MKYTTNYKTLEKKEWKNFYYTNISIYQLLINLKYYFRYFKVKLLQKIVKKHYTHPSIIIAYCKKAQKDFDVNSIKITNIQVSPIKKKIRLASFDLIWDSNQKWNYEFYDCENVFRLHRWNWLLDKPVDNEVDRITYYRMISSWCDNCRPETSGKFVDSYSIGERISNYVIFTHNNKSIKFDVSFIDSSIKIMCFMLSGRLEYHGPEHTHNHVFNNGRALFLGGAWTGNGSFRDLGKAIILDRVKSLVSDDGFFAEGSSHYHFLFTRWMLECLWMARNIDDNEFANILEPICIKLIRQSRLSY